MATSQEVQQRALQAVADLRTPTIDFAKAIRHWGDNERRELDALTDMVQKVCTALAEPGTSEYGRTMPRYRELVEAIEVFEKIERETGAARARAIETLEATRNTAEIARKAVNMLMARLSYDMAAESMGVITDAGQPADEAIERVKSGKLPKIPAGITPRDRTVRG